MEDLCKKKNPLKRGGKSQTTRALKARNTDYVLVDERDMGDLLLFAQKYAKHLRYLNFDHVAEGNWSDFFSDDVSLLIAILSDHKEEQYIEEFNGLLLDASEELDNLPVLFNIPADVPNTLVAFKSLFDYILSLAYLLDQQLMALPKETGLKSFALESIRSANATSIRRLLGYYFAAEQEQLLNRSLFQSDLSGLFTGLPADVVLERGLSTFWVNDPSGSWSDYLSLDPNEFLPVFGDSSASADVRIRQSFSKIRGVFDQLIKTITKIRNEAPIYLEQTVNEWPDHEPHMALFLAFLKLFRFAQDHLNEMTGRHLDYYYKEVLRLSEKAAEPDQAHLIVELAKNTAAFALKEQVAFKAGKDNDGNPVQYVSTEEAALNKTQIAALKAVYLDAGSGRLYASEFVNSADGAGLDIEKTDGRWPAFGPAMDYSNLLNANDTVLRNKLSNDDEIELVKQIRVPASVGFAVSSPLLFMKSGKRIITLTLNVSSDLNLQAFANRFRIQNQNLLKAYLSTAEGWLEKTLNLIRVVDNNTITIQCIVDEEDPLISPFDVSVIEEAFPDDAPVLKLLSVPALNNSSYLVWREIKIESINLHVRVESLKDFIVQGDLGRLDTSKPFLPFGTQGKLGANMLLGSKEVFQKPVTKLKLDFEWDSLPGDAVSETYNKNESFQFKIDLLESGRWETNLLPSFTFMNANYSPVSTTNNFSVSTLEGSKQFDYGADESFQASTQNGFIRINLLSDFGQKAYQRGYTDAIIKMANVFSPPAVEDLLDPQFFVGTQVVLLYPPYTPAFKSLALTYEAETTIDLQTNSAQAYNNNQGKFFQLAVFGLKEEHAYLRKEEDPTVYLYPQYRNEGEFYIGLNDLAAPQNLNILIQVAEGTAEPLLNKEPVYWSYLTDQNWIDFESADLVDATNGLIQSGIIQLSTHRKISKENPWMPAGLHWVRAHVVQNSKALCQLIDLHTQAALVSFDDQNNSDDFLAEPLPAESISKLLRSEAQIKKVQQPYSSFGGRLKEPATDFYRRVSERLRHKERAIAIWDYEHLILEKFPELFKVKCLNHTKVKKNSSGVPIGDQEIAPGFVTVVCLPDQRKRNAVDPLKPYTSLATLEAIRAYLLDNKMTLHLELADRLEVQNPSFEEIRIECFVTFNERLDKTIYQNQLNQDLIEFLSPWAFNPDAQQDLEFGGQIAKSVLIDFMEERPYVDFLTHVRLWHFTSDHPTGKDVEIAEALSSRSILVSHPNHIIKTEEAPCE